MGAAIQNDTHIMSPAKYCIELDKSFCNSNLILPTTYTHYHSFRGRELLGTIRLKRDYFSIVAGRKNQGMYHRP